MHLRVKLKHIWAKVYSHVTSVMLYRHFYHPRKFLYGYFFFFNENLNMRPACKMTPNGPHILLLSRLHNALPQVWTGLVTTSWPMRRQKGWPVTSEIRS